MAKEKFTPTKYQNLRGWFNWEPIYDEVAEYLQPGDTHVEIGTYEGRSLCYLWENLKNQGKMILPNQVRLVAMDPLSWHEFIQHNAIFTHCCHKMNEVGLLDDIELWHGYSTAFHGCFKKGEISTILVDGAHGYYECYQDLNSYWDKLKDGGYMVIHDYNHFFIKDVTIAVNDYLNKLIARGEKFSTAIHTGREMFGGVMKTVETFVLRKGTGYKIKNAPAGIING